MSDEQLRQYARLHKTDPYILALASSESKQRAEVRAAGQQFAQQPTIAEQRLAQMGAPAPMPQQTAAPQPQLPEQQGIGMLPAENVATMADGGIAGYGDSYADEYASGGMVAFGRGGDVPKYADEGLVTSSTIGRFFSDLPFMPQEYTEDTKQQLNVIDAERRKLSGQLHQLRGPFGFRQQTPEQQAEAEKLQARINQLDNSFFAAKSGKTKAEARAEQVNALISSPSAASKTPLETYNAITTPNTAQAQPQSQAQVPKARPGTGVAKDQTPATAPAPDFVPSKPGDLTAELKRLQSMNPGTKAYDDLSAKIKQGYADLERAREEGKPKDKAFAGLEALLGKEEEKAKGKEAKNFNMALINAGLAIAGGKSQYALQNIAEGAQVGTKQYQEGLEKLEAAALERRKQSAMIEEARRAEARGDWKDAQQFKQKAFEADLGVKQAQIAAVQDLYKTDLKTASDIVNNQNTLASADQRALMQQREETRRAREQNISAERIADKYANSRMGGAGLRGQITDDDIYKAYNRNMEKDTFGDFKKQFPDFSVYRNYILQQKSGQGGDLYADWGQLNVTNPKK
jgi:hypothetical protein